MARSQRESSGAESAEKISSPVSFCFPSTFTMREPTADPDAGVASEEEP